MPLTLLRLPRTNIWRAKYPALDFHVHARGLTSKAAYDELIALMDDIGMGAIVNLNGGTGAELDKVLAEGVPYKDRVANFITFSADGHQRARLVAEVRRGDGAGLQGGRAGDEGSQGARTGREEPGRSFIQADDPRLDPIWDMAAKYDKPVMIHLSDSIGRFYPIGPKNERYEAGLWHQKGDETNNYFKSGPSNDVIEKARREMHRKHPKTRFVNAHLAMLYYDPEKLASFLDTYPNADVEISATRAGSRARPALLARVPDQVPGPRAVRHRRQPVAWRRRVLAATLARTRNPRRVLPAPGAGPHAARLARTRPLAISGLGLPDAVLRKIYYRNALRHLPQMKASIEKQVAARASSR